MHPGRSGDKWTVHVWIWSKASPPYCHMLIEMCTRMCPGLPTDLTSELTNNMYLICDVALYVKVWQQLNYLMLKCDYLQYIPGKWGQITSFYEVAVSRWLMHWVPERKVMGSSSYNAKLPLVDCWARPLTLDAPGVLRYIWPCALTLTS